MSTAKHAKMLYILAFLPSNSKGGKKFIPDKILLYNGFTLVNLKPTSESYSLNSFTYSWKSPHNCHIMF
jgi:hypothetical protein